MKKLTIILMCILVWNASSAVTVYKSTDENGITTFSDTPSAVASDAQSIELNIPGENIAQSLSAMKDQLHSLRAPVISAYQELHVANQELQQSIKNWQIAKAKFDASMSSWHKHLLTEKFTAG